jgi:hypothetical protein
MMRKVDGKARMKNFTKQEYLERLGNLIPNCYHLNRLILTTATVRDGILMLEELAIALHKAFEDMVETDLVLDVKDAARDIFSLGRFLDISFETIMNDGA